LKQFHLYLSAQGIKTVDREIVIAFRDSLLQTCKPTTARLYLTAVKMFIRWLASKGYCANFADNIKSIKLSVTHSRDALTAEECKQVLKSFNGREIKSLRDKCILALMMTSGLRSVEIVRLDCGDIERRQGKYFIRVHGKARDGKVDKVQLPVQVYKLIMDYLKMRGKVKANEPLFTALSNRNKNQRLQTQTISRLAKKSFKNVGIDSPRITCHSCRHSCATIMLLSGIDISQVQMILRHRNPATTQIYRHDLNEFNNDGTITVARLLL
jgi:site-specific recombinase XerD